MEAGPPGWSRADKVALVLLVVGVLASLAVLVHPWFDPRNDASMYIATARAMAAGHGYSFLDEPFRVRPPGFSAMLAPLFRAFGTSFFAMNLLVSLFGAAAVFALYVHQRRRVGWPLALLTAVALWLNPGYRRLCNQVMSDVPGLALLLVCLLAERWAARTPSWRREVLLGACIGLSAYVRTSVVLLVPAIVIARLISPPEGGRHERTWIAFAARRFLLFGLVAWAVVLPWNVRNARLAPAAPVDQVLNYSISTAMWHRDPGDPGSPRLGAEAILARASTNVRLMSGVLGSRMQRQVPGEPPSPRSEIVDLGLALLFLAALAIVLVRRRAPAEIYAAGLLLVMAFYFVFTDRLLLPVYVIAFAALVEVLARLLRRAAGERAAAIVAPAIVLLLIALDFEPRRDWTEIEARHRGYAEIAATLRAQLRPDERLASAQGYHYGVVLDRPVYSLIHAVRRAGNADAAEGVIDKYGIETVVLSPLDTEFRASYPYFERRYGRGTKAASAFVWRVRPPRRGDGEPPDPHPLLEVPQ